MCKWTSRIVDLVCFVAAPAWTLYHLLDFHTYYDPYGLAESAATCYVYPTQIYAAIGIGIICLGFVLRSWDRQGIFRFDDSSTRGASA